MPISPLVFSGVSAFSSDFQTIVDRAVAIAELPIKQMQNQQTDILSRKMSAGSLQSAIEALAKSVASLGKIGARKGVAATSSDSTKVSIATTSGTTAATYEITDITSIVSAAAESSGSGAVPAGYATSDATPVSNSPTRELTLTVGGESKTFTLAEDQNTLIGLRDAINSQGLGVTATILTTGTGENPNYLSVTVDKPGATTLKLVDDPNGTPADLLTSNNQGTDTVFKLNGVLVSKASTLINDVVPGVSFNVLKTTEADESITIKLSENRTELTGALKDLATKYNAVASLLNAQVGTNAGMLSGNNIIQAAQQAMRTLTQSIGTGSIRSLGALGIELSDTGQMSFNEDVFNALKPADVSAGFAFLGSSTTGLGALDKQFTAISDPITGLIKNQADQWDKADKRLTSQIETITERISKMQSALQAKLQQADSLLARLESQQNVLDASFESLRFSSFGKQES